MDAQDAPAFGAAAADDDDDDFWQPPPHVRATPTPGASPVSRPTRSQKPASQARQSARGAGLNRHVVR